MVTADKPKGITITIRDRKENKSKTITVYDTDLHEMYRKIKRIVGER